LGKISFASTRDNPFTLVVHRPVELHCENRKTGIPEAFGVAIVTVLARLNFKPANPIIDSNGTDSPAQSTFQFSQCVAGDPCQRCST
jgi:hypothetical protein